MPHKRVAFLRPHRPNWKENSQTITIKTMRIVFVTGNANKVEIVNNILSTRLGCEHIQIVSQDLNVPEIQGTAQEIARDKCRRAAVLLGGPCLVEDTALCFEAWNGLPGPYIKHFHTQLGGQGLVTCLKGFSNKAAWAQSMFAYCEGPDAEPVLFEGRVDGTIVPPRGPNTRRWNMIFEPNGTNKTFAEMGTEQANKISHRSLAFNKFLDHLLS